MKRAFVAFGIGLAMASVSGGADTPIAPSSRPTAVRQALSAQRLRTLADASGHYDARLVQASLAAREKLLAHAPAQLARSSALSRGSAAAAPLGINWTEIGPSDVGGRINVIAIDSGNSNRLIVGAAGGGLWQSLDAGKTWAAVGGFPGSLAIGALAQLGANTWLAGTGDQFNEPQPGIGMVGSTDGGTTWTPIASTVPSASNPDWYYINSIAVSTAGVVLAATGNAFGGPTDLLSSSIPFGAGGLWRSTDGGRTWARAWPSVGQENPSYDVIFDPNNAQVAVADTVRGSVVYSTDGGVSWSAASGLPAQSNTGFRVAVAFDPSTAGSVYALIDNAPSGGPSGEVFHSVDGGQTWALLAGTSAFVNQDSGTATGALCDNSQGKATLECQGDYDNVIAVVPQGSGKPVVILTAGIDVFASLDGGTTWGEAGSWLPTDPNYIHADDHAIAYNAGNQTFYVGNDGGMFELAPAATTWAAINSGLAITQFYRIDGHQGVTAAKNAPNGSPITPILAGSQDNGMQLYLGYASTGAPQPSNWVPFFSGDGVAALVDRVDGDFLYGEYPQLSISYSASGGPSGQYFTTQPPDKSASPATANFVPPLALVPNGTQAANQMLAGGATLWLGNGIQSGNPSWSSFNGATLPVGTKGNYISAIEIDPNTNNTIWLGYDDGEIWTTPNATGASPTWSARTSASLPVNQQVTGIWVVPGQSNTVYVTYAGFSTVGKNVFESTDGGTTWTGIGSALPPGPVYSLVTDPNYPQVLYAGTYTGVYTSLDSGQTWTSSNVGPANIAVNQLRWFESGSAPVLLAATDGRGAWLGSPAYNPTPVLTGIAPTQVLAGSAATMVTLNGSGFAADASVNLDGSAVAGATVLSSTQMQVTLAAANFASAGTHSLTVVNPIPGGGTSAGATLTVANPQPTATSLSPASMQAGGGALTLTVTGTGFVSSSVVQWNGTPLTTAFVSSTSLTAAVPASNVATAGSATVTVSNPAPGGGASGSLTFTMTAAPSKGGGGGLDWLLLTMLVAVSAARVARRLPRCGQ